MGFYSTEKVNSKIKIYTKWLFSNVWFPILKNSELQRAKNTRICNYFCMKLEMPLLLGTLITIVPLALEILILKGTCPSLYFKNVWYDFPALARAHGVQFGMQALFLMPNTMISVFDEYSKILINLGISSETHHCLKPETNSNFIAITRLMHMWIYMWENVTEVTQYLHY